MVKAHTADREREATASKKILAANPQNNRMTLFEKLLQVFRH
jgi:hypothetical protein